MARTLRANAGEGPQAMNFLKNVRVVSEELEQYCQELAVSGSADADHRFPLARRPLHEVVSAISQRGTNFAARLPRTRPGRAWRLLRGISCPGRMNSLDPSKRYAEHRWKGTQ